MSKKEYVFLFEKLAAAGAGAEDAHANASMKVGSSRSLSHPLTPREQHRLDELEEELPLQTILMFRTIARKKVGCCRSCDGSPCRLPLLLVACCFFGSFCCCSCGCVVVVLLRQGQYSVCCSLC